MLVGRALAIVRVQHRWFELRWVRNWIPLHRVRTSHPYLLQFIPLGQGCNLNLGALNNLIVDRGAFLWPISLRAFIVVMLLIIMITTGVIGISIVKSWASICWILSKASCWALKVCSLASINRRRSSLLLSAMLADASPVCTKLIVAEEGYPLASSAGPLEKVSQCRRWCSSSWWRWLSIIVGYCYPRASTQEGTLLVH